MAQLTKRKAGRKYKVDSRGITSLSRPYQIILDDTMDAETVSFSGIPAIGSAHPSYSKLKVVGYDIEEGTDAAKKTLNITVNYAIEETETYDPGGGASSETYALEQWGWDSSTDQKELVQDIDGNQVLNSAGDPFDSVPSVSTYSPVFTKVIKTAARKSGAMAYNCKVNQGSVTIGDQSFPEGSILCSVEEQKLIGDTRWDYRYIIRLKYKTNKVKLEGNSAFTDIGWDVAVTDTGMREIDRSTAQKVMISMPSAETGVPCQISSPALLDGQGHAQEITSSASGTPYNFRFKAYERASFPTWFYSEA